MSTLPTPTHAHACTACGRVSLEDAEGFKHHLGQYHAYFWNGPPACKGALREATAEEFTKAMSVRTLALAAAERETRDAALRKKQRDASAQW